MMRKIHQLGLHQKFPTVQRLLYMLTRIEQESIGQLLAMNIGERINVSKNTKERKRINNMMMDLKNGNISQVLFFEGLRNIISTRKAKDFESIGFADEILFPDKITRMKFRVTRSMIRNVVTNETRRNDTKLFQLHLCSAFLRNQMFE